MPFKEFLRKIQECGLDIRNGGTGVTDQCPEVRHIERPMAMGVGSLYYPVIYRGDDVVIYPPTVQDILRTFGVSESQFVLA